MMLRAYLWKEWHDQKWILLSLAVSIPAINLVGWHILAPEGLWLPRNLLGFLIPIIVALLLAAGIVACDLVFREKVRGGMDFLSRLPGDMKHPFLAKAIILTVSVLLLGGGGAFHLLSQGIDFPAHFGIVGEQFLNTVMILFAMGLSLSYWCLAISCWMPRGAMVIPAAFLIIGTCWLPYILMWMPSWVMEATGDIYHISNTGLSEHIRPYPGSGDMACLFIFFLPLSSLVGAWISFYGFKKGGGNVKSACLGFIVLILAQSALWGWCSQRSEAWSSVKPIEPEFDIYSALIGEDGQYAFLTTSGRNTKNQIILNLKSNEWREIDDRKGTFLQYVHIPGEDDCLFRPWAEDRYSGILDCPSVVVQELYPEKETTRGRQEYNEGGLPVRYWDARQGALIDESTDMDIQDIPAAEVSQLVRYYNQFSYRMSQAIKHGDLRENATLFLDDLRRIRRSWYLQNHRWLVEVLRENGIPEERSSWNWMIYNKETREFSKAPCTRFTCHVTKDSDYSGWDCLPSFRVDNFSDAATEESRVIKMFPGRDHWIVQTEEGESGSLRAWYPAENRYDAQTLLSGNGMQVHSVVREWLVAEIAETCVSYLVHRQTLEVVKIPVQKIRQVTQTPGGSFVLLSKNNYNRCWDYVRFDPRNGKSHTVKFTDNQSDFYRSWPVIVGAPDEDNLYVLVSRHPDYYRHILVKVTFSDNSCRSIFPMIQE